MKSQWQVTGDVVEQAKRTLDEFTHLDK